MAEREMIALLATHAQRPRMGQHPLVVQRHILGQIVIERMAACLRFQRQYERRIRVDIDRFDRIHLDGDDEGHEIVPLREGEAKSGVTQPVRSAA